jgi:formylglycine-generating enzyme required for sulfatase activity
MIVSFKSRYALVLFLFLMACKTPELPTANTYNPYFDQSKKEYVKTPNLNNAQLDSILLIRPNIRNVSVVYFDTIVMEEQFILEHGVLAIPVEIINAKPPTYDTFLVATEYAFNAEFINSLFPVISDTFRAELMKEVTLSSSDSLFSDSHIVIDTLIADGKNVSIDSDLFATNLNSTDTIQSSILPNDSSLIDVENSFFTTAEILSDERRDLFEADSILSDLLSEAPWRIGDSIPWFQDMNPYFLDSILLLSFDTVYVEIYDPSKIIPQLSIDVLNDEVFDTIYERNEYCFADTVTFKIFHPEEEDIFIDMVRVQGGDFKIGDNYFDEDERPAYSISVNSFLLSKYEVTNFLFCFFLNDQKCDSMGRINGIKVIDLNNPLTRIQRDRYSGQFSIRGGYEQFPVVNVTWDGAQMFCYVNKGRLASEAEWEYAARGGVYAKRYYTGWDKNDFEYEYRYAGGNYMGELGWIVDNSRGEVRVGGRLKSNELGLFDMCGNVWEWCYDKYDNTFYQRNGKSKNPMCLEGPSVRVNRGGSWSSDAIYCRIANRNYLKQSSCNPYLGFRFMRKW